MNYFYYDGVSSADYNTYIADVTQFDSPKRDVETIIVPGRNGTLTLDNGRYENKEHKYLVYVNGDLDNSLSALRSWLVNTSGYRELKDTLHPDEYYMARFTDEINVEKSDHLGAFLSLRFDRMPQRFLESGRLPITITASAAIRNKTRFNAKPLIRAYGTGRFTIQGVTIGITSADTYTDIDCELQEAYKDTLPNSRNANITLTSGKFPELIPGSNSVSLQGITRLEIKPRWWTI